MRSLGWLRWVVLLLVFPAWRVASGFWKIASSFTAPTRTFQAESIKAIC
jgi:hypothetical protein